MFFRLSGVRDEKKEILSKIQLVCMEMFYVKWL